MEFDKKLLEAGLTKEMLLFFHSRTNNKQYQIKTAKLSRWNTFENERVGNKNGPIIIEIVLDNTYPFLREYTIDIAKLRQKKLNIFLQQKD
jgi:hypothetical protein